MNETKNCQTKCRMAPNPPTLALLALATALALAGCKKEAPAPPPPPVVQVMEITATNAPRDTEVIGQLDSPQNVEVRARVEAFVEKVLFVEGTEIKEGAPLFALDKKPFEERPVIAGPERDPHCPRCF